MQNENSKSKKLFVKIVGVAAAVAVIFLGVTQMKPATFLGGVGEVGQKVERTSMRVVPSATTKTKGTSFYIDVVLRAGFESPKDVKAVVNYDKTLIYAMYVDTIPAAFSGISQHYTLNDGQIIISGTLPEGSVAKGQDIVIGKIYFRALQNIGESPLTFDQNTSFVTGYEGTPNILGALENGTISITFK